MKMILLVEDEVVVALSVSMLLEDEGFAVTMAPNGKEGLARIRESPPDLIVTDFMMPVLDGIAMIEAVKSDPASAGIPVVMMSAVPETMLRERGSRHDAYLPKPATDKEILRAVRQKLAG